jgi:hypothetical protein
MQPRTGLDELREHTKHGGVKCALRYRGRTFCHWDLQALHGSTYPKHGGVTCEAHPNAARPCTAASKESLRVAHIVAMYALREHPAADFDEHGSAIGNAGDTATIRHLHP